MAQSMKIDFQMTIEEIQDLIKKHQDYYYGLSTFDFNIFEFA